MCRELFPSLHEMFFGETRFPLLALLWPQRVLFNLTALCDWEHLFNIPGNKSESDK